MTVKPKMLALALVAVTGLSVTSYAAAAVPADEAAKLKTNLTPLGGERAGNKEGTIPTWDGGLSKAAPGRKLGDIPVELFAGEKPVAQITAKNVEQYTAKLSEGTKALFKKYPDTFRVDVYPTHRTAAAPQWIYDNTFKNATRCKVKDPAGVALEACYGGIPFPIPKDGYEIIWNYLLRIEPESIDFGFKNLVTSADGSRTLATRNDNHHQFPYYYKDGAPEKWSGEYFITRFSTTAPPFKVGEALVLRESVDMKNARAAWQYLVGQRRVRRAPTVAYDTPDFVASGANYFDEVQGFLGAPDRYQWKLIGKQEMYVPYNNNHFVGVKGDQAFTKHHFNPEHLRWELHRVWVVEASVAAGKRHAVPKRRYYFDEDTYLMMLMDGYDAEGKLWRTSQFVTWAMPSMPAILGKPTLVFNLQANTSSGVQILNDEYYKIVPRKPENYFTGDAVAEETGR